MAYEPGNCRVAAEVGGSGPGCKIWILDTVDAETAVDAAGYISDGQALGFRKGDIVFNRRWTTTIPVAESEVITPDGTANDLISVFIHFVIGISATTGAPDLTNGLAITATNGD